MKRYDLMCGDWHMTETPIGLYVLFSEANARGAELEAELSGREARYVQAQEDRNTANARIAELEARRQHVEAEWLAKWTAVNARADEAELERGVLRGRLSTAEAQAAYLREDLELVTQQRNGARRALVAEVTARKAANARADAAELERRDAGDARMKAESEAAALRAEVDHLRGEHLHPCGAKESELIELRVEVERLRGTKTRVREAQLMHSLSEARAEVERLWAEVAIAWDDSEETNRANRAESSLTEARALLVRVLTDEMTPESGVELMADIGIWLANQEVKP